MEQARWVLFSYIRRVLQTYRRIGRIFLEALGRVLNLFSFLRKLLSRIRPKASRNRWSLRNEEINDAQSFGNLKIKFVAVLKSIFFTGVLLQTSHEKTFKDGFQFSWDKTKLLTDCTIEKNLPLLDPRSVLRPHRYCRIWKKHFGLHQNYDESYNFV